MLNRIWKKSIAALCGALCGVAMLPAHMLSASADAARPIEVLALGDDCLAEIAGGASAAGLVADYFGGNVTYDATVGAATADLLNTLQTSATVQQDVADADVILVSAGVNDLMDAVFYNNPNLSSVFPQSTLMGMINAMPSDVALPTVRYVLEILPSAVATINNNLTQIASQIKSLNSTANVVVQTVNNPIAIDFAQWSGKVSQNRQIATAELYSYLDVCLQGGTYTSDLLANTTLTIDTGINQTIGGLAGVSVSDFYGPFVGAAGESGFAFTLTDIANLNMTFTPVGQVVLASSILSADPQLAGGNGSVLTDAYNATGQSLSTSRASLHSVILNAAATATVSYQMGDINGDGSVGIDDAYQTLQVYSRMSVGYACEFGPAQRCAADVNGDRTVGIADAYQILLYYATYSAGGSPSWN